MAEKRRVLACKLLLLVVAREEVLRGHVGVALVHLPAAELEEVVDLLPVLSLLILARGASVLCVTSEFGVARRRSRVFDILTIVGLVHLFAVLLEQYLLMCAGADHFLDHDEVIALLRGVRKVPP